jgi:putative chitinase
MEQFIKAIPNLTNARAQKYYAPLMTEFTKRNFTPIQIAHFLSQIGHESLSFIYTKEIWGPTPTQIRYEGRKDLGNTQPGDGKRFMGRGLIQVTGRANYKACSLAIYGDDILLRSPEILEAPNAAIWSAFWYWDKNKLSVIDDVVKLTRKINGGVNGLNDRKIRFHQALNILT